jgi:hypothetical protein
MDSIKTHPMPLGALERRAPGRPRRPAEPLSWADDMSRPWSETMPAPDPAPGRVALGRVAASMRPPRLARWGLTATALGVAWYALRWMLHG